MHRSSDTDILVVGAGAAGLATAVTALRHGARVLIVERRPGTSTVPRATAISTRTMELFRAWGIARAVRAAAIDVETAIAVRRTLADEPQALQPGGFPTWREALAASPESPAACPQDLVEPLLVEQVRALGGEIRFGAPLRRLTVQGDGSVVALVGAQWIRARFVVGADGPRSAVRSALGIGVEHLGQLGDHALVVFRPELAEVLGKRPHGLSVIEHPDAAGVLLPVGAGRWVYSRPWDPADGHPAELPTSFWARSIRTAVGLTDLEPEIVTVAAFTMSADVATTYRSGPGFLVGDAAHRMTPIGGRGMNTAVHDGHELGWRLGWVVRGLAGDALLDSYAAEREPVGRVNAEQSVRNG